MKFTPASIPVITIIEPRVFEDARGFFMETFREKEFEENGINAHFVQDNHSGSRKGALRGLHYQLQQAQGKLIRVVAGEVFDVAVDIRRLSPTFGQWVGMTLSAQNKRQVWIPAGFAHGYYVMSDWAEIVYKATNLYAPTWERTILWNDPQIGINWPVGEGTIPIISSKDMMGCLLSQAELYETDNY